MKRAGRTVIPAYGENVKRHLEQFDYEASLNSVSSSTRIVLGQELTRIRWRNLVPELQILHEHVVSERIRLTDQDLRLARCLR